MGSACEKLRGIRLKNIQFNPLGFNRFLIPGEWVPEGLT